MHTHNYNSELEAVQQLGMAIDLLTVHLNWVSAYSWAEETAAGVKWKLVN